MDGKIQNGRISTTLASLAVVSIKLNQEHLCSGCLISKDYFITSYFCSCKFYTTYFKRNNEYTGINPEVFVHFGNEMRIIQETIRLNTDIPNFLLFDVALAKVVHLITFSYSN